MVCREAARRPAPATIKAWSGCAALVIALHAWLLTLWPRPPLPALHLRPLQVQLSAALPGNAGMGRPPLDAHRAIADAQGVRAVGSVARSSRTSTAAAAATRPTVESIASPDAPSLTGDARPDAPPVTELQPIQRGPARRPVAARSPVHPSHDAAEPVASALDLPVYATALPPAGRWHYRLQHDGRAGGAELQWQHDNERYSAQLSASDAGGAPLLSLSSRGALDAAGLAPQRFVDRRGRRGAQAANFQRDAGAITYSGAAVRAPLPAGAQDRLSQWLQLWAIVAAAPGRWSAGSTITTYASGAHGDAEVWRWQVLGLVALDADVEAGPPAGPRTLKLWRAAPRPYDTEAEAWLDPARGYLPLRLRWRNGAHVVELRLQP